MGKDLREEYQRQEEKQQGRKPKPFHVYPSFIEAPKWSEKLTGSFFSLYLLSKVLFVILERFYDYHITEK
jgi:hypothetical protein